MIFGASATAGDAGEPPTRPMTIHSRHMPNGDDVRCSCYRRSGYRHMANSAPVPATRAPDTGVMLVYEASSPSMPEFVDQQGREQQAELLAEASVYSAMKRHPTRSGDESEAPRVAATAEWGEARKRAVTTGSTSDCRIPRDVAITDRLQWGRPRSRLDRLGEVAVILLGACARLMWFVSWARCGDIRR